MKALQKIDTMVAPMKVKWYAKPNDLIGGWCVMPIDKTPGSAPKAVYEVATFCSKETAEHIASLHNQSLELT